jgi:hypothetical protein
VSLLPKARVLGSPISPASVWPPQKRAPLPPFPIPGADPSKPVWAENTYDHEIWFDVPNKPDLLFYRGQFSGIALPDGMKPLVGMAGFTEPWVKRTCVMAQDIPRFWLEGQRDNCEELLRQYGAVRGLTHLQASICHLVEEGEKRGWPMNKILDFAIEYLGLAHRYVPFLDPWMMGGVGSFGTMNPDGSFSAGRDQDVAYWRPKWQPWFDELKRTRLIQACCVGWQLDGGNTSDPRVIEGRAQSPIQSIIDYVAGECVQADIPVGAHWMNEAMAWRTPMDRFAFWREQHGKLTWGHHQGDVNIPVDLYQAKIKDTLDHFGDGSMGMSGLHNDRPFGLVVYEQLAQKYFDDKATEDDVDLRGFLICCTKARVPVSGYGNGARRPDGSVL